MSSKIGIIGFGRFGKLTAEYLAKDFKVYVSSRSAKPEDIKNIGAEPASFEEVCKKDFIIPCVPVDTFEKVIKSIKNLIKESSLVIDVCAVKEYPVEIMEKELPKNVQILGSHPIFGPDSHPDKFPNRKIALCKVRVDNELYDIVKGYLKKKGLVVIEIAPKDHDKEIARSLFLTHFIGRGLIEFDAKEQDIDTEGYKRLLKILDTVKNDSWQLFEDMNKYNKQAKNIRQDFIKSLNKVDKRLK